MSKVRRVATITVGAHDGIWLERCFRSLLANDRTGLELRSYYVDNASTDGSRELVRGLFPEVRVIENPRNEGFARANNIGIIEALRDGAEHVFLVNPDTECPAGLIRGLAAFLDRWPAYGIVGPMQFQYGMDDEDRTEYNEWSRQALENGEGHAFVMDWPDHPLHTWPRETRAPNTFEHAYVQGAALYTRSEMLDRIGLFDEVFHAYYEEVELCRRARLAGWRVALLLDLGIHHRGGGSTAGSRFRRVHMLRNKYYYLFTDVDWPAHKATRLALRWLKNDVRGRGADGRSNVGVALAETFGAAFWLAGRVPVITRRRRANLALRAAAGVGPPL